MGITNAENVNSIDIYKSLGDYQLIPSVFPEPVFAAPVRVALILLLLFTIKVLKPRISLPAKACGIAAAWISVAISKFAADKPIKVRDEIGSESKRSSPLLIIIQQIIIANQISE